ncbi:MAG: amidohydrolase, partial [bacterium]
MQIRMSHVLALALPWTIATAAIAVEPADRILKGAAVVTVNAAQPVAEAIAIRDGRIVAVGAMADVLQWQGPQTQVDDLSGRTILPGFIDAHGHLSL